MRPTSTQLRALVAARSTAHTPHGGVDHDARPAPGESITDFIVRNGVLLDWSGTVINVHGTYATPAAHYARLHLLGRFDDYIQHRPAAPTTRRLLAMLDRVGGLRDRHGRSSDAVALAALVPLLILVVHRPAAAMAFDSEYAHRLRQAEGDMRALLHAFDGDMPGFTAENFTRTANQVLRRLTWHQIESAAKFLD